MTRRLVTKEVLEEFFEFLGKIPKSHSTFYITGGTTSVYFGIRAGTIDIDLAGDLDEIFSEIPRLKKKLNINIETAKPTDFVPPLEDEESRHILIGAFRKATFYHFDPYSQVFSKIVRAHGTDMVDAKAMIKRSMVDPTLLLEMVRRIPADRFARYTRLDRNAVEQAVEEFVNLL